MSEDSCISYCNVTVFSRDEIMIIVTRYNDSVTDTLNSAHYTPALNYKYASTRSLMSSNISNQLECFRILDATALSKWSFTTV